MAPCGDEDVKLKEITSRYTEVSFALMVLFLSEIRSRLRVRNQATATLCCGLPWWYLLKGFWCENRTDEKPVLAVSPRPFLVFF